METCPCCNGKGSYLMEGDLHKSSGMVPCNYRTKEVYCANGKLRKWSKTNRS